MRPKDFYILYITRKKKKRNVNIFAHWGKITISVQMKTCQNIILNFRAKNPDFVLKKAKIHILVQIQLMDYKIGFCPSVF